MKHARDREAGRYCSFYDTALGCGAVVAGGEGLVEIFLPFAGRTRDEISNDVREAYPAANGASPLAEEAAARLVRYFAGEDVTFNFPLDLGRYTPFQQAVYRVVAAIPWGTVRTYTEVAAQAGSPRGARGIGQAMARNLLPIIIPCHRVVGASGCMTGYSAPGGISSKQWLLRLEGVRVTERGRVGRTEA
ncbi:methylated-DNA--[protein]-cysteine S-methyltransferase [Geobacter sp. DSM 9736]|uniref:methylated-DNA--[protein]-cysteine S-methyltransferase n=1 Tax=Geobacter sp. DSM 9736 TaxID=1277350 RepID=UPI000B50DBD0|nr:methylated-DNA--[protein]-cysteine S-methyltransferase [Geobacter sp. DSM 9736]SNB44969.1 methylated-DNA-[protein]-cysteine S-methyltransferase [Geobacter sp. DSM 9736]